MIKVRDPQQSAKRFVQNASAHAEDYKAGVQAAGADWQGGAIAGNDNFKQGVQEAIARDAFLKGVKNAGGDYYAQRAATIGGARFATGVQAGSDNYVAGVTPYVERLRAINLPPKGPKGAPQNFERARAVANALRLAKTGQTS